MKKWIITTVLMLIFVALAVAEECTKKIDVKQAINCTITSTWVYPSACNSYSVHVYDSDGGFLSNYSMIKFGETDYCYFYWNISETGSYVYNVSSGDTGNITVEATNLVLNIIIGVGIIAAVLLFIAFKLDKEHFILKLLLLLSAMTLLILIPANIMTDGLSDFTFYRVFLYIFVAFWLYVGLYFVYWILKQMNIIVANKRARR